QTKQGSRSTSCYRPPKELRNEDLRNRLAVAARVAGFGRATAGDRNRRDPKVRLSRDCAAASDGCAGHIRASAIGRRQAGAGAVRPPRAASRLQREPGALRAPRLYGDPRGEAPSGQSGCGPRRWRCVCSQLLAIAAICRSEECARTSALREDAEKRLPETPLAGLAAEVSR